MNNESLRNCNDIDITINDDNILNSFKLPIEHTDFKYLNDNVISDLELDLSRNAYNILFSKQSYLGNIIQNKWKHYYSSDITFLKIQQRFIKSIYKNSKKCNKKFINIKSILNEINDYYIKWKHLKNHTPDAFIKKFQFIEWDHIKFLNNQPLFLQAMSYYNISSPLIHILLPIILLIIPFFLIKIIMRIPFTFSTYKTILFKTFQNHAFGKMFNAFCSTNCGTIDVNTKVYATISFTLYIFTLYQNILGCIKFYQSTHFIHEFICDTKKFINNCNIIHEFVNSNYKNSIYSTKTKNIDYYSHFVNSNDTQIIKLNEFMETIKHIDSTFFSVKTITNIGIMMHSIYEIFSSHEICQTFSYWFGCCGFVENHFGIIERIKNKNIHFATLTNKNKPTTMNNLYYIYHLDTPHNTNKIIKNHIDLKKNIIISGPNASGKTTILKSLLVNVILTQQFGIGCYDSCVLRPYDYIESYINIPDTTERDSLFQAEARRCLNIIHHIQENPNNRILCIFDELFSGTNPYEAQKSAITYLNYLHNYNVSYVLTTHFEKLKHLDNSKCEQQYMCVDIADNNIDYKYKYILNKGISNIYGGFKVLRDLEFPNEIIKQL